MSDLLSWIELARIEGFAARPRDEVVLGLIIREDAGGGVSY